MTGEPDFACDILPRRGEPFVDLLGAGGERAGDTTDPLVCDPGEEEAVASIDQLGQRVLHQRECSWLVYNVVGDALDQPALEFETNRRRRIGDRSREVFASRNRHREQRISNKRSEIGDGHWAVEIIGPERRDDPDPAAFVSGDRGQTLQK